MEEYQAEERQGAERGAERVEGVGDGERNREAGNVREQAKADAEDDRVGERREQDLAAEEEAADAFAGAAGVAAAGDGVGELEDGEAQRIDDQHGDRGEEVQVIALLQPVRRNKAFRDSGGGT